MTEAHTHTRREGNTGWKHGLPKVTGGSHPSHPLRHRGVGSWKRWTKRVPIATLPKIKTKRGRASLRKRTAVEHAISHHIAHQGRRARYKGLRKNQFDGRRHAAVSNLQVAAHYEEELQLAS